MCRPYPKLLVNVHTIQNMCKSGALNYVRRAAHL